jgi:hypothetical protein
MSEANESPANCPPVGEGTLYKDENAALSSVCERYNYWTVLDREAY